MKHYIRFIPIAAGLLVITVIFMTIYGTGQFLLRTDANYPQVEIAENIAAKLSQGSDPNNTLPSEDVVNLESSLGTFVALYNDSGKLITTNARLNSQLPVIPEGVLEHARNKDRNQLTWQPTDGVRSAIVAKHYSGTAAGFVVTGRSLREVEKREDSLLLITGLAWLTSIILALVGAYYVSENLRTK